MAPFPYRPTKDQIIAILDEEDLERVSQVHQEGDRIRREYMGDAVHIRGIIEFSNYCHKDCLYCGLRRSNDQLFRYRMNLDEIFEAAKVADSLDFKTVVLQSGEDPAYAAKEICSLVARIKNELNVAITLCIGEKTFEEYRMFKDAGADRYLLKFETSNPSLFKEMKPDSAYLDRLRRLEWLGQLGYQVGSGNIVGLPGQTSKDLADDILLFEKMELDMIGIGPFLPHPNTPLASAPPGTLDRTLRAVAMTRVVTRDAHIPATTAVGTIDPSGRQKALQCGANVVMPNATPRKFRKHYQIYPNKICQNESPENCRYCIEGMVSSLGRKTGLDFGHTRKHPERADGFRPVPSISS